ncbi:glycosyltransferase family 87 protein [Flavobacterium sp.]|uniref:glycosyltransferase family 87 protein n=1 Tax=Flavobacterium sp. TaxID=239 RepID=UPI00286CB42B|nr:glycosyltransferase family 87 protein [Flavobacterium sp.]
MKVNEVFKFSFVKVLNFDKAMLPIILLCLFYVFKAINFPIHDFANYYFGGKFLTDGTFNTNIYFPYYFNKNIANLGYNEIFVSYAPNTPFLALTFLPFSFLEIHAAKIIFNCISTLLFLVSIYKLFSFYKVEFKFILLVPILFFVPIKNELLFGQVYFLLFFLLTEFCLAYEKKQLKKAAVYLSIAIVLKVFPIVLLFIFIFKKQFKNLFYCLGFCALWLGISILFTGADVLIFYIQKVVTKASNGEISEAFVTNYQSVFMFLKELLVFDSLENSNSFFNNPVLFSSLVSGFKIALMAIGYYVTKKISNQLFVFSYWIATSILLSPYGSTYTFILLIFPFVFLAKSEISSLKKMIFIVFLLLICNLPIALFISNQFPFSYLRLLFLLLFFGLFISLIYHKINWKTISLCIICALLFVMINGKNEINNSNYLNTKNPPILIYDYKIENNNLTYFYWNEKGENKKKMKIEVQSLQNLQLKNNQLFLHNKQLTFDNSNKLKPVLINNKTIIYMSDSDKGIGFYSLKKITIN